MSENWLLMALLTPTFWAIDCLVDSCLVGRRIYRRASDGAIVSCLFCVVPVMFVLGSDAVAFDISSNASDFSIWAMAAGLAYATHLFFYFRVLFRLNDVSGAETFLTLSVLVVPLFAFLLLGEVLPARFHLAFGIAAVGVTLQCLPVFRRMGASIVLDLIACVVAVSLSMVLQSHALATHGYAASTLVFNLTGLVVASILLVADRRVRDRIVSLLRHFPVVLLASELLGMLAVLSSHRATQYGPSVSIVAMIECLLPLIIIGISLGVLGVNRLAPVLAREHRQNLRMQTHGMPLKSLASMLLLVSIVALSI